MGLYTKERGEKKRTIFRSLPFLYTRKPFRKPADSLYLVSSADTYSWIASDDRLILFRNWFHHGDQQIGLTFSSLKRIDGWCQSLSGTCTHLLEKTVCVNQRKCSSFFYPFEDYWCINLRRTPSQWEKGKRRTCIFIRSATVGEEKGEGTVTLETLVNTDVYVSFRTVAGTKCVP